MTFRRGVSAFAILSVAAVVGVFFYTSTPGTLTELARAVNPALLATCILVPPLADWLVAGLRLRLFTSVLAPRVSYLACVRNCAVGGFMGAATPSQTGGGVAQAYVLVRDGATIAEAVATLFMTFLSTLVFYSALSVGLWVAAAAGALRGVAASGPFVIPVLLFGGLGALGLLVMARPAAARRWLEGVAPRLRRGRALGRAAARLAETLAQCGDAVGEVGRRHKLRFAASVGLSVLVFANKYLAGYLAARALGLDPPLVELILVQAFLNVLLYFFPTPGASGGAEVSAAVLMAPLVPAPLLAPYTLLWRTATTYLSVVVGGIVLVRYLRRDAAAAGR
jgi:uncharacterized protein (TIRG00374 family)